MIDVLTGIKIIKARIKVSQRRKWVKTWKKADIKTIVVKNY